MNKISNEQTVTADAAVTSANQQAPLATGIVLLAGSNDLSQLTPHAAVGLPPVMSGTRYDSLRDDIQRHGIRDPICVDENNVVWDGRTRLHIARELNITVPMRCITAADGPSHALSGLVGRKMTVPEQANFIWWVSTEGLQMRKLPESLTKPTTANGDPDKRASKKRNLISWWVQHFAGWTYSVSPKTIEKYIKLADAVQEATPELLARLNTAKTVTSALAMLESNKTKRAPPADANNRKRLSIRKLLMKLATSDAQAAEAETKLWTDMLKEVSNTIAQQAKPTTKAKAA